MTWKFDKKIAQIYNSHVNLHIPSYNKVLDKTLQIVNDHCKSNDIICDFGCANGNTLLKLHKAGFINLIGVDNSTDMIDICPKNIAKYYSNLPNFKYRMIIANWVLHFNKDKMKIIENIYNKLDRGGVFLLTEKTSTFPYSLEKYHQQKKQKGITDTEIEIKTKQLENSMFINISSWYLTVLSNLNFEHVEIIDADWCFTTFLCYK